jgi:hypothetical protein
MLRRKFFKIYFFCLILFILFFVLNIKAFAEYCCVCAEPISGTCSCTTIPDKEFCSGEGCALFYNSCETNSSLCKDCQCINCQIEIKEKETAGFIYPKLSIPIPGFKGFSSPLQKCLKEGKTLEECKKEGVYEIPWLGEYIFALYTWSMRILAILAIVMITIGGFQWLISGGNREQIAKAKSRITSALIGLILILCSNLILSNINPRLTILKPISIKKIEAIDLEPGDEDLPSNQGEQYCLEKDQIETVLVEAWDKVGDTYKHWPRAIKVHKDVKDEVKLIFQEIYNLEEKKGIIFPIKEIIGFRGLAPGRNCRNSLHAKGLAIDINPDENLNFKFSGGSKTIQNGQGEIISNKASNVVGLYWKPKNVEPKNWYIYKGDNTPSEFSIIKEVVDIFKEHGWCWGGWWKNGKDFMHFSKYKEGLSIDECWQVKEEEKTYPPKL